MSGPKSRTLLNTSFPILFKRPPQIVDPATEGETEDEEEDGDYADTESDNQDDWQEDLRYASGLDTSPDQGLL